MRRFALWNNQTPSPCAAQCAVFTSSLRWSSGKWGLCDPTTCILAPENGLKYLTLNLFRPDNVSLVARKNVTLPLGLFHRANGAANCSVSIVYSRSLPPLSCIPLQFSFCYPSLWYSFHNNRARNLSSELKVYDESSTTPISEDFKQGKELRTRSDPILCLVF